MRRGGRVPVVVQGLYLIATGIVFVVRGVITLQDPTYWEPVSALDYAAVWTFSLALLLIGPAFLILVRQARAAKGASVVAWVVAVAAVLTAVANAVEDAFDQEGFGALYVVSVLVLTFGQVPLVALLARGDRKAFALVPALTFVGLLATSAGGGIVIGATWVVFGILVLAGRTAPTSTPGGSTVGPPTPS